MSEDRPRRHNQENRERAESTLVNRNVVVGGRRTSIRLEPAMWEALEEICRREGLSIHQLHDAIDQRRRESSLTAAIRVFILSYYRVAATEHGHSRAGHGLLDPPCGAGDAEEPD